MPIEQIDLLDVFINLQDEHYCVVKLPQDFPCLYKGEDLDLFCYDTDRVAAKIIKSLQKNLKTNISIKLKKMSGRLYIDLIENEMIMLRFDLYGTLPEYKNVDIKESFFSCIIEGRVLKYFKSTPIYVPSKIDESIIRYIEYHEWYERRPDKLKHINYIQEQFEKNKIKGKDFFSKLHYFTQIPALIEHHSTHKKGWMLLSIFLNLIKSTSTSLRENGLKKTTQKIIQKFKLKSDET